jgi:hypothetical protein
MNKKNLDITWKIILIMGIILASIDAYSEWVYNKNFFPDLGLIMIVILLAVAIIQYYSNRTRN